MAERFLTDGEKKLAAQVFGSTLDTRNIKIKSESFLWFEAQDKGTLMAPDGNIYVVEGSGAYSDDYSKLSNIDRKAVFIHELTHIWQKQNGMNVLLEGAVEQMAHIMTFKAFDPYKYGPLSSVRSFEDLGLEEQAQVIQDYYLLRFHNAPSKTLNGSLDDYKRVIPFEPDCFIAGTSIDLSNGTLKNIEDIVPGDCVSSFSLADLGRGEKLERKVLNVFRSIASQIIDLRGLHCTPGHIFLSGDPDQNNHEVFLKIADILRNDGCIVEQDGTVIRARTGARINTCNDAIIAIIYRGQSVVGVPGVEHRVLVRAGISLPATMLANGTALTHSSPLAEHLLTCGITVKSDGNLYTPDGIRYEACNWPEGTTPFDSQEAHNWIVELDGQPYTPPWIRDLVEEDETQGLRIVGALPTAGGTAALSRTL